MKLLVATKNEGKIREIKKILNDHTVISQSEAGIFLDVVEDGDSFKSNALKKAREICLASGEITIADDSGLCVDFLGGKPGIYSARFAGEDASDEDRNTLLLKSLEGANDRSAKYVCAIAICYPDKREFVFEAECTGSITKERHGKGGFGYDPIFFVDECQKTFGEIPQEEKDKISHRAKALGLLKEHLENEKNEG